jgi:crotonobetainyl-CoA:carnitine CoA-transferase CaiB-like acyl-CoA transferase
LRGYHFELRAENAIAPAASALLEALGARATTSNRRKGCLGVLDSDGVAAAEPEHVEWARSGAMHLTGHGDGPPLAPQASLCTRLRAAQAVLALLSARVSRAVDVDVLALLAERAALGWLSRHGSISVGEAARLLPAGDGWIVVNLPRSSDLGAIPAWLELDDDPRDPWDAVAAAVARRSAADVVERAQLLEIAAAIVPGPGEQGEDPQLVARTQEGYGAPWLIDGAPGPTAALDQGPARLLPTPSTPLVIDLSPLWAGPLCAHLLGLAGCRVVKVESVRRPDAARAGAPPFFDLLHASHDSVALDLGTQDGQRLLRELVLRADVLIEESRPRALAQMGISLDDVLAARPHLTWVSITGYGRTGPWSNRVAFGDDAAAAAGVVVDDEAGAPVFCADAIADPITGVYAAIGALASLLDGGGHVIDVPLREAAGYACGGLARPSSIAATRSASGAWEVVDGGRSVEVVASRARRERGKARPFGVDTERVLREFGIA